MIDPVEQIKERLSIVDVVSSYISLSSAGKNHKANCPFHNEKTPSFHVSPDRGSYYCFGCGAKGDIFSFVQEFEGLDFKGALSVLAERAGVKLVKWNGEKKQKLDHLYEIMEKATRFFEDSFQKNSSAKEYLNKRGVSPETQKDFRIGYAPNDWRLLFENLTEAGYEKKDLILVGLIKEGNGSTYDRFRDRIMFPIFDTSGRPIAFSGRALHEDDKTAKYLNSPDTPLFQKSDILYGLHVAKNAIRKSGFSVLVEGQLDLLLSHQAGFPNTVAASGTALTESVSKEGSLNHFGIIKRLSNNVILAFDSDPAGLKAMYRATKICLSLGMEVKTVDMPAGKDPADIINSEGRDVWKKILKDAEHSIIFLARYIKERESEPRVIARRLKEKILPLVALLDSTMEQQSFVQEIATITGISSDGMLVDLKKVIAGFSLSVEREEVVKKAYKRTPEKEDQIKRMVVGIYSLLIEKGFASTDLDADGILEELLNSFEEKEKTALMFEIEAVYKDDDKKLREDFDLYVKEFRETNIKNQLNDLEIKIRQGAGDDVLKQYQEILKNISNK